MTCNAELVDYLLKGRPDAMPADVRHDGKRALLIDACTQLREQYSLKTEQIDAVELRVGSLVKDLCYKKVITAGLEGKVSICHAAAIGRDIE